MGTLTAYTVRLEGQCEHKLPTSCRLSATLECCACQDKRSHAATYSTYVDGVGMVSRGTRWQRYCWYCQRFWENRVKLQGIDPKVTRVPLLPDPSEFCARWYEYQSGHRKAVREEDGFEYTERLACEVPWHDTPPGHLPVHRQPRTADQPVPIASEISSQPHVTIEEALESMCSDDESEEATSNAARGVSTQGRTQAPIREELTQPAALPSEDQIREAQTRLNEALDRKRRIANELSNAETELRVCREQHRQVTTAQQRMRNFERVFGTREDVRQQGESYQSPLSAMFQRAWGWHHTAEEVRAAERDSNRQTQDYERILSTVREPWLRRTLASVRRQVEEDMESSSQQPRSLDDERIQRPPPKSDAEMTVSLSCRVCWQQVSDTAVLPCGHLVMCGYCAEIAMPTKDEENTLPARRDAKCLLCRKNVKRLAKIYLS